MCALSAGAGLAAVVGLRLLAGPVAALGTVLGGVLGFVLWALVADGREAWVQGVWFSWLLPGWYLGPWAGGEIVDARRWRRVFGPVWRAGPADGL
jgi:hypothetical protein